MTGVQTCALRSIDTNRVSPRRIIVTGVLARATLLDHDPGVYRKNTPPAHRSRGIYPDQGVRMIGSLGEKPGARSIRDLPVSTSVSQQIVDRGYGEGADDQEEKKDHEFLHRMRVGGKLQRGFLRCSRPICFRQLNAEIFRRV